MIPAARTFVAFLILSLPAISLAQDRTAPSAKDISDRDLEPIAGAIRDGEAAGAMEARWTPLLEPYAGAIEDADAHGLTMRAMGAAMSSVTADLERIAKALGSTDRCTDEARAIDRERTRLEGALAKGERASAGDVENALAALGAMAGAMDTCAGTLRGLELQETLQRQSRALQSISDALRAAHDTAMSTIQNMK